MKWLVSFYHYLQKKFLFCLLDFFTTETKRWNVWIFAGTWKRNVILFENSSNYTNLKVDFFRLFHKTPVFDSHSPFWHAALFLRKWVNFTSMLWRTRHLPHYERKLDWWGNCVGSGIHCFRSCDGNCKIKKWND